MSLKSFFCMIILLIYCSGTVHGTELANFDVASITVSNSDPDPDAEISEVAIDNPENSVAGGSIQEDDASKLIEDSQIATISEDIAHKYEKIDSLEPILLITGKPGKNSRKKKKVELKGQIIPERHPVGRRRYIYRWVLKLSDGSRVPLKSNLKLLQKVKDEEVLDGFVSLQGTWLISPSNKNLKFFKIFSLRVIDEPEEVVKVDDIAIATDTKDIQELVAKTEACNGRDGLKLTGEVSPTKEVDIKEPVIEKHINIKDGIDKDSDTIGTKSKP